MKRRFRFLIFMLAMIVLHPLLAQREVPRLKAGLAAGFGLPRIPWGSFTTPISVAGTGFLSVRIADRWVTAVSGGGLYTFNIGTVSEGVNRLRFELFWGSIDNLFRLQGSLLVETFVLAGVGYYDLYQAFGEDVDDLRTPGISLGVMGWRYYQRWSGLFELRWHMLFSPSDTPQVLTLSIGILI